MQEGFPGSLCGSVEEPLWQPSKQRIAQANLTAFMAAVGEDWGVALSDYAALYDWSIREKERFWQSLWSFCDVRAETRGDLILVDGHRMPGARWFPEARLNFAENLLRRRDEGEAVVFWGEGGKIRRLSHGQLYAEVSRLEQAFRARGVREGDRIAGYLPNLPETLIGMLAAASIGAIWSSCSPDFGPRGVLDRFGQIEPKLLLCTDGYLYNGKRHDCLTKLSEVLKALPSVEHTLVVPFTRDAPPLDDIANASLWEEFLSGFEPTEIAFRRFPFDQPLYIMYSSGTTGAPKCIVHGAGGTLLQHLKEHQLQCDVKRDDRVFYFTTCGWMMWNWLVSALASEAALLLYDGSPTHPDATILFDLAERERCTLFGTSAKFIDALGKQGLDPMRSHDLSSLRTVTSTGSPLAPESFDYVYAKIKRDLCLSSIAGGTDIISCFMGGNPIDPVRRGEIQARGLGMQVEVFDDAGRPVRGEKGELVCTGCFPSMPVGFWNDPEGAKYHAAYFEHFPGVWCHGDFVELTEHDGIIIYGRSDTVLNPGGVRIGTAEIYRQVEQLDAVMESLVIGQSWEGDVRIVLFVVLRPDLVLDDELAGRIRRKIRENATPRHVPAKILQVSDIPRTKSGKIVELAVRDVVHGKAIKNLDALANPEALDQFKNRAELQT
jgi:acetoacetyl-CoA synthetase